MNFECKFAVFALNLMTLFQESVKLIVAPFLELLNIFYYEKNNKKLKHFVKQRRTKLLKFYFIHIKI